MVSLHYSTLVEYKPLRSSPSIRLTIDVNELEPETVKELHRLLMLGGQKLTVIITATDDLKEATEGNTT